MYVMCITFSDILRGDIMPIPNYYHYGEFKEFESLLTEGRNEINIEKGTVLKAYSECADTFYYIKKGLVKATINHIDGYEKIVYISGAGCIEPGFSFERFCRWEESIQYEAYMDLVAVVLNRGELADIFMKNPELMRKLCDNHARGTYSSYFESLRIQHDEGIRRVCDFIYYHISDSKVVHGHEPERMSITQNDIANLIGIDRVNINRILQSLRREGIIDVERKRVVLLDKERLIIHCSKDIDIGE